VKGAETFVEVYLYRDVVDFRKSIDGLAGIVADSLKRDAFSGALFVFCSRSRDKIKALYWDRSGYALWYKRLEEEKFVWPRKADEMAIALSGEKLRAECPFERFARWQCIFFLEMNATWLQSQTLHEPKS
jgi:transposase